METFIFFCSNVDVCAHIRPIFAPAARRSHPRMETHALFDYRRDAVPAHGTSTAKTKNA
jgi:hypothetical protein